MASLSGSKIKDTYSLLLKLASSAVSATEQIVEDGAGNSTALKLSTDTVETTGDLKISGTPAAAATSDVTALMLSSTGIVVARNLSTSPIGTAGVTANSPLTSTGSTVGVLPASSLANLPFDAVANNDAYLIWDESAAEYKYITANAQASYIANNVSIVPSVWVARLQNNINLATSDTDLYFAEVDGQLATGSTSPATSCVAFGTSYEDMELVSFTNPRDGFQMNVEANYDVHISLELVAAGNTDVTIKIENQSGPSVEIRSYRTLKAGIYTAAFSKTIWFSPGDQWTVAVSETVGGTTTVTTNSTITITKFG